MLEKIIIGGVTLAAIAYAVEEVCEEQECPWDMLDTPYKDGKKSKKFHKFKKGLYKKFHQEYRDFIKNHHLTSVLLLDNKKLQREHFKDEEANEIIIAYIQQISETLTTLTSQMAVKMQELQEQESIKEKDISNLERYAQTIETLTHIKLFGTLKGLNQIAILSNLTHAMELIDDNKEKE